MDHASNSQNAIERVVAGTLSAVRLMAARFTEKFGAPEALLKRGDLYDGLRQSALRWLCDMEACVRRLLLLRAASFPPPQVFASEVVAPRAGMNEPRPALIAPPWRKEGDPETLYGPSLDASQWRVCFAIDMPREAGWLATSPYADKRRRRDGPRMTRKPAPNFYWADDPRPIAERFEALRRVLENPDHYATRLAARLHYWRGRAETRQALLRSLCATAQIANEAGLDDDAWAPFAEAREIGQALMSVFAHPIPSGSWRPSG